MKSSVKIRKIDSYDPALLDLAIKDFLDSNRSSKLSKAKRVLIKTNALGAYAPERAVTTHPAVLEALIKYLLAKGKDVWLGDSPGGSLGFNHVFETCGYTALAEKYPIKLVNLSTSGTRELISDGYPLRVSDAIWRCGAVINVAKYKTHSLMAFTGALKNLYGLVPGMVKTEYHKEYPDTKSFASMLVALYLATRSRITYSIIDGIVGMEGAGPAAGNPRSFGLLFGSSSIPALDLVASRIMGFRINDIPYLFDALHKDGILPSSVWIPTSFRGYRIEDAQIMTAKLSSDALKFVPRFAAKSFKKIYDTRPMVGPQCQKCGVCVKGCPVKAIAWQEDGYPLIDPGMCIKCMCCHELCPYQKIEIKQSWLVKTLERFS